jgi:negative regulator of genetic competence, sporulation and motility
MKQKLTLEQVKELDDLGFFEKYMHEQTEVFIHYNDIGKLLTIGKMIEILGSNLDLIHLDGNNQYNVMYQDKNSEWVKQVVATELTDALFTALKEVL